MQVERTGLCDSCKIILRSPTRPGSAQLGSAALRCCAVLCCAMLRKFHNTAIVRWNDVEIASILEETRPKEGASQYADLRKYAEIELRLETFSRYLDPQLQEIHRSLTRASELLFFVKICISITSDRKYAATCATEPSIKSRAFECDLLICTTSQLYFILKPYYHSLRWWVKLFLNITVQVWLVM